VYQSSCSLQYPILQKDASGLLAQWITRL
jgi:hypothetical protein